MPQCTTTYTLLLVAYYSLISPILFQNGLDLHGRLAVTADAGNSSSTIGIGDGCLVESSELMAADGTKSPVGVRSKRCGYDWAVKDCFGHWGYLVLGFLTRDATNMK